jgi:hypothetical protein
MKLRRSCGVPVARVKARAPIAAVVGSFLPLEAAGTIFKAPCPFHAEDNPSFTVYPETQTFKCFGCGAHGDVIAFVQQFKQWPFARAIRFLWRHRQDWQGAAAVRGGSKGTLQRRTLLRVYGRLYRRVPPLGRSWCGQSTSPEEVFSQCYSVGQRRQLDAAAWAESLIERVQTGMPYDEYLAEERALCRFCKG